MNNITQLHHGIINVGDLPIPFDIVLNAAVLTIILTFVFLKISWKESILTSKEALFSTKQSTSGKSFGFFSSLESHFLTKISNFRKTYENQWFF